MKIYVKDRWWIDGVLRKNPEFYMGKEIVSIYSSGDVSPFPDRYNILKLNFDDIIYPEILSEDELNKVILFDKDLGYKVFNFANEMNQNKVCYVHCDAGISRSGAIGTIFNEYFNKNNEEDYNFFKIENKNIVPNDLVIKILKEIFNIEF